MTYLAHDRAGQYPSSCHFKKKSAGVYPALFAFYWRDACDMLWQSPEVTVSEQRCDDFLTGVHDGAQLALDGLRHEEEGLVRCIIVILQGHPVEDGATSLRISMGGEEVEVAFSDGKVVAHLDGLACVDVQQHGVQ